MPSKVVCMYVFRIEFDGFGEVVDSLLVLTQMLLVCESPPIRVPNIRRIQLNRLGEVSDALVPLLHADVRVTAAKEPPGIFRVGFDGLGVLGDGFPKPYLCILRHFGDFKRSSDRPMYVRSVMILIRFTWIEGRQLFIERTCLTAHVLRFPRFAVILQCLIEFTV